MKLIIDIGNTKTKIALFSEKKIISKKIIEQCTFELVKEFVSDKEITSSIISSVKDLDQDILNISNYYKSVLLNYKTSLPIKSLYKTPKTLGNDRIALVTAANFLYKNKDVIIIDAGTCITIDFLNKNAEYLGGRISPGISMRFQSLNTFTDKLPLNKLEKSTSFFGNDTDSAINSGVQRGVLSELDQIIYEYNELNPNAIVILCGGDAFYLQKELKSTIFVNQNLVLIGLNEILDYNE